PRGDLVASLESSQIDVYQVAVLDIVYLIGNNARLFSECVEFLGHGLDRFDLIVYSRVGKIDNVNEQVGFAYLLAPRFKRFNQGVWQFSQKSNRVGEQETLFVWQHETARRRIERREQFVFRNKVRARQQIQERRFPRVGVTDNRCDRPLMSLATLSLDRAGF